MKRVVIVLLILAAIGAGAATYYLRRGASQLGVTTAQVTRGDVVETVASTGTLQAVTTVQVGSQVSGNIAFLGADFNSIVKKGQVIAKLDPSLFQAQVEQARANLNQQRANLAKAQSDLERMKVQLLDAQQKYTRAKELADRKLEPQADLDAAKIAVDSARASLGSQQATVAQTQASITASQANLNQAQVNMDHTIITAPIDGIVTQRNVDVGQTVAASMQAPTLFIIAADLTKMQVSANIDESDVGNIRPGQRVTFKVDAYPTDTFEGTVTQIRLQPTVVSNVTTYGTIINVPNPDLRLKPGMTANLKVEIMRRDNVLRVPNTAVRFRPTAAMFAGFHQEVPAEALAGAGRGRGRGRGRGQGAGGGFSGTGAPGGNGANAQAGADAQGGGLAGANGGGQGFGGGRAFGGRADMMERFAAMSPEQQQQFIARLKDRGQDTSALEAAMRKADTGNGQRASSLLQPKYGETSQGAETIDALFAPLATPRPTPARVWVFTDGKLKPIDVRLGITDGTNTELVSGALPPNTELVTAVTEGAGGSRPQLGGRGGNGNPFQPQRGFGPGGGFRGR